MGYRRKSLGPVPVLLIIVLLVFGYYLSRWRYMGSQMRYDRLTGRTEQRVEHSPERIEWQPMPDYRYGKPVR